MPESNRPSRDVTECGSPEKVQCTVSPTAIVRDAGENSKFIAATVTVVP